MRTANVKRQAVAFFRGQIEVICNCEKTKYPQVVDDKSTQESSPQSHPAHLGNRQNETHKPRLSNSYKSRTLKKETLTSKCLSQQKRETQNYVRKGLINKRRRKEFHCFPDRKRSIVLKLCNITSQRATLCEEIFIFFFFTRNKTIKVIQKSRSCEIAFVS